MPFQPGQSGNPEGKKLDKIWRDALRKELIDAEREDRPYSPRNLARALLKKAAEGDVVALKEVGDRIDGKVPQAHVGDEEAPAIQHSLTVSYK